MQNEYILKLILHLYNTNINYYINTSLNRIENNNYL